MNYRFVPPRLNIPFTRLINVLHPYALTTRDKVTQILVPDEDWARLAALKNRPALILCNHPSLTDPPVVYGLSRRLKEPWYYMASSELFAGWQGSLLNHIGAYSVRQGSPDRESLKMTQEILMERGGKVVILPEAEPHYCNDRLMSLNPGAVQTAFWTAERMAKLNGDHPPSLPILPVIIRYKYVGDALPVLLEGMARLESAIGTTGVGGLVERLQNALDLILSRMEEEYRLPLDNTLDAPTRVRRLFMQIETRICATLNIPPPKDPEPQHRQRALYNAVFDFRDEFLNRNRSNTYEERRSARRLSMGEQLKKDLRAYENFMSMDAEVLGDYPSLERVGEMLIRLEREVWRAVWSDGKTFPLREAHVRIAPPMDAALLLTQYRENKRKTLADVNRQVEHTMRGLLSDTEHLRTPIP